jgi:amino acid adenylation domain-containing protein
VPALIEAMVDERPLAVAVMSGRERQTFRELDRRANRIAQVLTKRGLGREAPVAVFVRRSLDLPAAVLAVLKAGGAFVLLDPDVPPARSAAMLAAAGVFAILSHRDLADRLPPELFDRTLWLDDPGALAGVPEERLDRAPPAAGLAYIMFTSGSTGTPKGVMVPHSGLRNRLEWVRRLFPFADGEVVCQKTPLGFIDAIWEILGPLRDGIPCVLPPGGIEHDPALLSETLERAGVTRIMLVPSLLRALLTLHEGRPGWLPRLTLWMVGGEEVRPELVRDFLAARDDARLINLYGLSEVSGEATWHPLDEAEGTRVPIGLPGPNVRVYVLDRAGEPAPPGVWGELHIGGAGVARGYLADPGGTARRFVPDPFDPLGQGARLFRTGDRARQLAQGVIEYAGRLDHQLKIRGVRVDPGEVEEALCRAPSVLDAAVVARPGAGGELRLAGYVVARDPARPPRPAALRAHLRRLLPEAMVPTILMRLDALPLSSNRKVDREALPEPVEMRAEDVRPRTATEIALATLWDELLHTAPYGLEDDFFAKGGYSLLLGQLAIRIRATFGVDVPLHALFQAPTLGAEARYVDEAAARGARALPIEPVPRQPRMPLSFAQERMWLGETMKFDALPHVVALALHLHGPLDAGRLERAMDAVAERHESLRTTFAAELGVPFQTVHAALPRRHERVDLSALPEALCAAEVARRHAAEYGAQFDLPRGPPWRSAILRLGAEEHVLLVTMSHLVSDGASVQCWLEEVAALYATPAASGAELPELAIQPADLAVWGRRAVSLGLLDQDRAYWREVLGPAPAPPDLPADGPRGRVDTAGWMGARIPSTTLLRLRERAHAQATTLFTVLLASLGTLVAELQGEPMVTLGVLSAGREAPEAQRLIGLFLNTVPVRFVVGADLGETVRRAHAASMGALSHGAVPFERIVADVNAPREPGRNPIFDVALNHVPRYPDWRLGDTRVEALDPPATLPSPFDLMWRVFERRDGLQVSLEYRRGRFAERRAEAWLRRYVAILGEAAGGLESVVTVA